VIRIRSVLLAAGGVAVLAAPGAAQPDRQRLDTTFAFTNGMVDVRSVSGPISITTWNRREVRISAFVERGEIVAELSSSRVRLEAKGVRGRLGDHEFTLVVPAGTRVEANAVSGDVTVRGTRSDIDVETVSGDVRVEDVEGRLNLSSVSGDIAGERVGGTVRFTSVSGEVRLRDASGSIGGESVSGSVEVEGRATSLRLTSVSGDLTYRGGLDPTGRFAMQAHSGTLTLVLPDDARADLTVKTFTGQLDTRMILDGDRRDGMRLRLGGDGRRRRDAMRLTLGGGGATVDLETFSGTITLRKSGAKASRED